MRGPTFIVWADLTPCSLAVDGSVGPVACAVQPEAELSRYGFSSFASLELESEPGVLKYLRCTTTAVND